MKSHTKQSVLNRISVFLLLFLTGSVFVLLGINRGEMEVVLRKAINICLECIGIG